MDIGDLTDGHPPLHALLPRHRRLREQCVLLARERAAEAAGDGVQAALQRRKRRALADRNDREYDAIRRRFDAMNAGARTVCTTG